MSTTTTTPKPKRALPAHLAKYKFQKGQPRPARKTATPAAAPVTSTTPAAPAPAKSLWDEFWSA